MARPRRSPIELAIGVQTDRQLKYEARQRASGLTKACVWVPSEQVDQLKELARHWREQQKDAPDV